MTEVITNYDYKVIYNNEKINICCCCKKIKSDFSYKKNGTIKKTCDYCLETKRQIRMYKEFIPYV